MGWASAGAIFDPVARAMVELGAPDEMKIRVLGDLIGALQDGDWDTECVSLDEFQGDPAIVEAFRQHDVIVRCGVENANGSEWCERERCHAGDHDGGPVMSAIGQRHRSAWDKLQPACRWDDDE
jgi:hypothetical protein